MSGWKRLRRLSVALGAFAGAACGPAPGLDTDGARGFEFDCVRDPECALLRGTWEIVSQKSPDYELIYPLVTVDEDDPSCQLTSSLRLELDRPGAPDLLLSVHDGTQRSLAVEYIRGRSTCDGPTDLARPHRWQYLGDGALRRWTYGGSAGQWLSPTDCRLEGQDWLICEVPPVLSEEPSVQRWKLVCEPGLSCGDTDPNWG